MPKGGSFNIIMVMDARERKVGVLMHITSLPGDYGIGDLGREAYRFIDSLSSHNVGLWQILPTGPTGFGDSPYAARSAFAGNELFISLEKLYEDGYLELDEIRYKDSSERVNYAEVKRVKLPLLFKAAARFLASSEDREEYNSFLKESEGWLPDYALFQALCERYNDSRWYLSWPDELKLRDKRAIKEARERESELISLYSVLQYFFFKEWGELKSYANERGVKIIGDIPIFVAADSADAWSHPELLKIDQYGRQEKSSGVPPDAFSSTGQLWGNPLYRWEVHEKTGFAWWIDRIRATLKTADIIRIDHFRGFEACWEVDAGEDTAMNGRWVKGPGQKFFDAINRAFGGELQLIAEDLGVITPEVEALRDGNGLPGMKIFQFAFGFKPDGTFDTSNLYLPHNYDALSVAYTGTHDNDTTLGWYNSLDERARDFVRRYLECSDDRVLWSAIKALMASHAMYVIFPFQDILALGEEGRMNIPSTVGTSNWSWRAKREDIETPSLEGIRYYAELYGRVERSVDEHHSI